MKFAKALCYLLLAALVSHLAFTGQAHAAYLIGFTGLAALTSWSSHQAGVFCTNTIPDGLKLTRVLNNAIIGLKAGLAPLAQFSTCWSRDPITPGNDDDNSITVPVYDYLTDESEVKDRTPGQAYSSKVSDTTTSSRKLSIDKEKVIGLSFTAEEAQNQVRFDPEMHGLIKGHLLAQVVIKDIFSVVRHGRYPNPTLAPMAATAFDENDVADLAQLGMEANWPEFPQPGLVLNPAFHFNLVKQPVIIGANTSGSTEALRSARVNQIMGMMETGTNGLPLNNGTAIVITTVTHGSDLFTKVAHGLLTGDQVVFTTATTLPAGLSLATYYYVIKISDDTFKVASSLANAVAGTVVNLTDDGTGAHSVTLTTNLVGVAGASSGIITGFRPVMPTPGQLKKLIDFRLVTDEESGLTLEYRQIADEDKGIDYQIIGVHYGKTYGVAAALKLISKSL